MCCFSPGGVCSAAGFDFWFLSVYNLQCGRHTVPPQCQLLHLSGTREDGVHAHHVLCIVSVRPADHGGDSAFSELISVILSLSIYPLKQGMRGITGTVQHVIMHQTKFTIIIKVR